MRSAKRRSFYGLLRDYPILQFPMRYFFCTGDLIFAILIAQSQFLFRRFFLFTSLKLCAATLSLATNKKNCYQLSGFTCILSLPFLSSRVLVSPERPTAFLWSWRRAVSISLNQTLSSLRCDECGGWFSPSCLAAMHVDPLTGELNISSPRVGLPNLSRQPGVCWFGPGNLVWPVDQLTLKRSVSRRVPQRD
jgi:hypothetical protein